MAVVMTSLRRFIAAAVLLPAVAGCSGPPGSTFNASNGPSFDLSAVKTALKHDCLSGAGEWPDGNFLCDKIGFDSMSGDDTILRVPTTLAAGDSNNADTVCFHIAKGHRDPTGQPLGYLTIGVLDAETARMYPPARSPRTDRLSSSRSSGRDLARGDQPTAPRDLAHHSSSEPEMAVHSRERCPAFAFSRVWKLYCSHSRRCSWYMGGRTRIGRPAPARSARARLGRRAN